MPYFSVILNARFGYSLGQTVKADRQETLGDTLCFYLDERLVYQVPVSYVRGVREFSHQAEASRFFKEERRRLKEGYNLAVEEKGAISRPKPKKPRVGQTGIPAESISLNVEEIGRARRG